MTETTDEKTMEVMANLTKQELAALEIWISLAEEAAMYPDAKWAGNLSSAEVLRDLEARIEKMIGLAFSRSGSGMMLNN